MEDTTECWCCQASQYGQDATFSADCATQSNLDDLLHKALTMPLSETSYHVIAVYMTLVCGLSLVGNTLLCVTMLQTGTWRNPAFNLYIFTISVAALIESLAGFPLLIASNFKGRWMFGELGCSYYAFVTYTCVLVAMTCYLLVSVHRYRVVCMNVPSDSPDTRHWIACSIIGAWTYSVCWSVCPFLGWGSFSLEPFATSCSLAWATSSTNDKLYNTLVFMCLLFLPVGAMICCSTLVLKKLNMQVRHSNDIVAYSNNGVTIRDNPAGGGSQGDDLKARSLKILMTTLVLFVLFWSPYGVMSMLANFSVPIHPGASALPTIMAKTHCAINPLVYFACFRSYRLSARQLFSGMR